MKLLTAEQLTSQSNAVVDQVIASKAYENAKSLALFLTMPTGELQTDGFGKHISWSDLRCPEFCRDFFSSFVGSSSEAATVSDRSV